MSTTGSGKAGARVACVAIRWVAGGTGYRPDRTGAERARHAAGTLQVRGPGLLFIRLAHFDILRGTAGGTRSVARDEPRTNHPFSEGHFVDAEPGDRARPQRGPPLRDSAGISPDFARSAPPRE